MERSPLLNWWPQTEEHFMLRWPSWMFVFQGHSPPWRIYSMCTVVIYFNSPQTVYMLEYSDFPLHCLGGGYRQHRYHSDWGVYMHFGCCVFYWCVTLTLWLFLGKREPEVSWSNRWGNQHRWGCCCSAEGNIRTRIFVWWSSVEFLSA